MIINGKEFYYLLNNQRFHCAMDITMHYIGGKWKTVVLWYLRNNTLRFSELKNKIPDITEKMLSIQLKKLEEDGIVKRSVYTDSVPMRVEYELTDFGKTLLPVIEAIAQWGRELGMNNGKLHEKEIV